MDGRLNQIRQRVRNCEHSRFRQDAMVDILAECDADDLSLMQRAARLTRRMCEAENVVIEPDEHIVFTRTIRTHLRCIPPASGSSW